MGIKGDKLTQNSTMAAELLVSKLEIIEGISAKKMFGGHGLFHEGKMFGIVDSKGQYYLKADDSNRSAYETNNSHQHGKMPYFSIPLSILNDNKMLIGWVRKSIAVSKSK